MPSLTETLQTNVRAQTGTVGQMNEDLHAFFTLQGIPLGQLMERMLAYGKTQNAAILTASAAWNYILLNGVISALALAQDNGVLITLDDGTQITVE